MVRVLIILIFVLAGCTSTTQSSLTTEAARIEIAVQGTLTAEAMRPPTLISPVDGTSFNSPVVSLSWEWYRQLNTNELFDVRVWREGQPHYGITWHGETTLDITSWLTQQEPGNFYWSVAVIIPGEQGSGSVETVLTHESESYGFTIADTTLPAVATPVPAISEETDIALVAPEGFKIEPYVAPLGSSFPTTITFHEGLLYVLTIDGDILALHDADGDNFAETVEPILRDTDDRLTWATGLAFYNDLVYISDSGRISTLYDADDDGLLDWSTFTTIVEDLPSAPFMVHSNNSAIFYEDKLYVPVGSITDHDPVTSDYEATILRMNPDGTDIEVIARGLRNPFDIAIAPNGDMFTSDNSPDTLDKTMMYLPPEEINHIREGRHYGYPDYYGNAVPDGYEPPVTELYTSSATTGLVYYAADQFPEQYRNGLFAAQWGTASGTALGYGLRNGYAVLFVTLTPTDDGTYQGQWEIFVQAERPGGWFRPTDVTVGPDGALYIAETTRGGMIQRVTYVGETETITATPTAAQD